MASYNARHLASYNARHLASYNAVAVTGVAGVVAVTGVAGDWGGRPSSEGRSAPVTPLITAVAANNAWRGTGDESFDCRRATGH